MTSKERKELATFVNRYKEIEISISTMQTTIESLAKKRDGLFEELDQMKGKEKKFQKKKHIFLVIL